MGAEPVGPGEKRKEEGRGRVVLSPRKVRRDKLRAQSPDCSHRAGLNRLGGQQIPDGPHLGGCGHPVAPQGPEGIVGLVRRGWEYGTQDRESFTKLGWVQPSRPPSRMAGESCVWSPAGGKKGAEGWKVEESKAEDPPRSLSISVDRRRAPQWDVSPCLESIMST